MTNSDILDAALDFLIQSHVQEEERGNISHIFLKGGKPEGYE